MPLQDCQKTKIYCPNTTGQWKPETCSTAHLMTCNCYGCNGHNPWSTNFPKLMLLVCSYRGLVKNINYIQWPQSLNDWKVFTSCHWMCCQVIHTQTDHPALLSRLIYGIFLRFECTCISIINELFSIGLFIGHSA